MTGIFIDSHIEDVEFFCLDQVPGFSNNISPKQMKAITEFYADLKKESTGFTHEENLDEENKVLGHNCGLHATLFKYVEAINIDYDYLEPEVPLLLDELQRLTNLYRLAIKAVEELHNPNFIGLLDEIPEFLETDQIRLFTKCFDLIEAMQEQTIKMNIEEEDLSHHEENIIALENALDDLPDKVILKKYNKRG